MTFLKEPWPGPSPFDEASSPDFHGRDRETLRLSRMLVQAPLVVLFGAAGVGKTSLLQAGLFPYLRQRNFLPVYIKLDREEDGDAFKLRVKATLASEIKSHGIADAAHRTSEDEETDGEKETLWEYLHRADLDLWSRQNYPQTPVLIFDQFEDVFRHQTENYRMALRTYLAELIENRVPTAFMARIEQDNNLIEKFTLNRQSYRVVLSLREDFLPALESWKQEIPSILRNRMRLLPMSENQALEAVYRPELMDESTAKAIVKFVSEMKDPKIGSTSDFLTEFPVEPALLSVLCRGLNTKRKKQRKEKFDIKLLEEHGDSIVADYYEGAMEDLPEHVQRFIEEELITEHGSIQSCTLDYAREKRDVKIEEPYLQVLENRRLIRIEPHRGTMRVELSHELLTTVVRKKRDQRRQSIVLKWAFMVTILALFAVLFVIGREGVSRRGKNAAISERLGTASLLNKDNDRAVAALLAVEAKRFQDTFEARNALFTVYQSNSQLLSFLSYPDPSEINSVAFSPNSKWMAAGMADGSIHLWNLQKREQAGGFLQKDARSVRSVAFSPDSSMLASADDRGELLLWNLEKNELIGTMDHQAEINCVVFSPKGDLLLSGGSDGKIKLWDTATLRQHEGWMWLGYGTDVNSIAFIPDKNLLASAGSDGVVHFWDMQTKKPQGSSITTKRATINSIAISHNNRLIAIAGSDGNLRIWDIGKRKAATPLLQGHNGNVYSVAFSSDDRVLASAGEDKKVLLWDWNVPRGLAKPHPLKAHTRAVTSVAFSPDGTLLGSGSRDKSVILWNPLPEQSSQESLTSSIKLESMAFSPDGNLLAAVNARHEVQFWKRGQSTTGELANAQFRPAGDFLTLDTDLPTSIAFSQDSTLIATGGNKLQLWDVGTPHSLVRTFSNSGAITSLAFSPDGETLVSGSADSKIYFWKLNDGSKTELLPSGGLLHSGSIVSVAFNEAGDSLVSLDSNRKVLLWNVTARKPLASLGEDVTSVAFIPHAEGAVAMATGTSNRQQITLWNWSTSKNISLSNTGQVRSLTSNPDGTVLAARNCDRRIRLWDIDWDRDIDRDRQMDFGTPLPDGKVGCEPESVQRSGLLTFSPDGKALASLREYSIELWTMDPDVWKDRLCKVANRNLTRDEWRRYIGPDEAYHKSCNLPDSNTPDRNKP
jgi:WD40 repeat protein